jgi:hypothetical protein
MAVLIEETKHVTGSPLYHLTPLGVGTSGSESLFSFIARLAMEHCVSVGTLIEYVINPARRGATWERELGSMHGENQTAADWVNALTTLTFQTGLCQLTMLPWTHILNRDHLVRRDRVWCPHCYNDDRATGITYDRLIWSIQEVTVCPVHKTPLESRCPHCGKAIPYTTGCYKPGRCPLCGADLAVPAPGYQPLGSQYAVWSAT